MRCEREALSTLPKRPPFIFLLAVALAASFSTWFYVNRILKPQQIAEGAAHNRPRGNLSDLYPRWLGARELLLHRRNPYSPEITRDIQQGYYGRPLDASRPEDPKDQQAFAYPAYVVFLLAPSIKLPFEMVQAGFRWLLIALAVLEVFLWLRVLRWRVACGTKLIFALLIVGWLPMVQGIKLQQLSLLVAVFLALSAGLIGVSTSRAPIARELGLFVGGVLLACATIKPQLAWPLVLFLLVWVLSDWRTRRSFLIGFVSAMLALLISAELLLPGWVRMFLDAIRQYHQYTQNQSVLVYLLGPIFGRVFEAAAILLCALHVWHVRNAPATSPAFGRAVALVLALTVLVVPMFAPYNQVLLIPAIFALLRSAQDPMLPAIRFANIFAAIVIAWPWIASITLTAAYPWITPEIRQRVYLVPFYSNFEVPVLVFGLTLVDAWMHHANTLRDALPAE